jgi:hypothetical protein
VSTPRGRARGPEPLRLAVHELADGLVAVQHGTQPPNWRHRAARRRRPTRACTWRPRPCGSGGGRRRARGSRPSRRREVGRAARRGLADEHDSVVGGGEPLRGAIRQRRVVAAVHSPVVAQPEKSDRALTPEVDEADPPPLVLGQHTLSASRSARGPARRNSRVPRAAEYLPLVRAGPLTADSLVRAAAGPVSAGRRAGCARTRHRAPAAGVLDGPPHGHRGVPPGVPVVQQRRPPVEHLLGGGLLGPVTSLT